MFWCPRRAETGPRCPQTPVWAESGPANKCPMQREMCCCPLGSQGTRGGVHHPNAASEKLQNLLLHHVWIFEWIRDSIKSQLSRCAQLQLRVSYHSCVKIHTWWLLKNLARSWTFSLKEQHCQQLHQEQSHTSASPVRSKLKTQPKGSHREHASTLPWGILHYLRHLPRANAKTPLLSSAAPNISLIPSAALQQAKGQALNKARPKVTTKPKATLGFAGLFVHLF